MMNAPRSYQPYRRRVRKRLRSAPLEHIASASELAWIALATLAIGACVQENTDWQTTSPGSAEASLKELYDGHFLVGAALNVAQFSGQDEAGAATVKAQFNAVTPENALKWSQIHPEPDTYAFEAPDRFVAFGEENGMFIVGHTLIWHRQTPAWVFEDEGGNPLGRDALLDRMRDHIHTVVGRYRGRIHGWDVVNEALNEDGTFRQTPWMRLLGEDYVVKAFEFAHEADPDAELYYNDYALENAPKRDGAIALVERLLDRGAPITGVGLQGHNTLTWPTIEQQETTIEAFHGLGLDVMITELDLDVLPRPTDEQIAEVSEGAELGEELDPYPEGLPDSVQRALADRYAELFRVYLEHRNAVTRVTFWGVTDGDSWRNHWPVRGRTNYPLLFDRRHRPKPAFDAVARVAAESNDR